jgi:DNA segregation ATPase FtsK/SpoIIIE-like protein
MDELEQNGIVGMPDGSKARKVLVQNAASKQSKEGIEETEDLLEDE